MNLYENYKKLNDYNKANNYGEKVKIVSINNGEIQIQGGSQFRPFSLLELFSGIETHTKYVSNFSRLKDLCYRYENGNIVIR